MAQRVTLAIPGPLGSDVNVGADYPLAVTFAGAGATSMQVQGTSASGTTQTGNPVKVGGVVNTTAPSNLVTGQAADLWVNARGAVQIAASSAVGTDGVSNTAFTSPGQSGGSASAGLLVGGNHFNGTTWDRVRGDTNGTFTVAKGSATMATSQISVGTVSTLIVAARVGRSSVTITNLGATDIFIGNTGVALTTGTLLVGTKGAAITIPTSAAIYGIASVAQSVSFIENY